MNTSEWCDACHRADGVPHPCCPMGHDEVPLSDGVPVGARMPLTDIGYLTEDPPYVCCAQGVAPTARGVLETVSGTGVAGSAELAATIAISEVLERMALYLPPLGQLVLAGATDLGEPADRERRAEGWWVAGERLDGQACWVPLDWVQLTRARRSNMPGRAPDSTGTAAHEERGLAVLSGRLEWLERSWVRTLLSRRWGERDRVALPPDCANITDVLGKRGCRSAVTAMCRDGLTFAAAVVGDGRRLVGGAACDASLDAATYRALAEAFGKAVGAGLGGHAPSAADATTVAGPAAARIWDRFADDTQLTVADLVEPGGEYVEDMVVVSRSHPGIRALGREVVQLVSSRALPAWSGGQGVTPGDHELLFA